MSEELWDKANEILDARSKKHDQINKNNKYNSKDAQLCHKCAELILKILER